MDNHAVPRQITTFEFKLLGFFTVKQGVYLSMFAGIAALVYFSFPGPVFNIISAIGVIMIGVAMVLYKYNERTLDVWIKNITLSLLRPSQYYFHKNNEAPDFLKGVFVTNDVQAATHIDAHEKLSKYMNQTGQVQKPSQEQQKVQALIHSKPTEDQKSAQDSPTIQTTGVEVEPVLPVDVDPGPKNKPFLSGIVHNSKGDSLPNIMVYVNSEAGQLARILKTNHNGIFATFHALPTGTFSLAPKDLGGSYFFDTINVPVSGPVKEPVQIYSRETL